MGANTLRVVATLRAQPGKAGELRAVLEGLIAPTRAETGCIRYELQENVDNPAEFVFVEEWTDQAALDAHFETDHIKAAVKKAPTLLAEELDLRRYRLLG